MDCIDVDVRWKSKPQGGGLKPLLASLLTKLKHQSNLEGANRPSPVGDQIQDLAVQGR